MSYRVLVDEDRSGTDFATGRPRVWREQNLETIDDAMEFIRDIIREGYRIKYAAIVHNYVKSTKE